MDLTILIESEAGIEAQEVVKEVFAEHGFGDVDVRRSQIHKSADIASWLALIIVTGIGSSIGAFFQEAIKAAAQEAGKEGWRVVQSLVKDVATRRQSQEGRPGNVVIQFEGSGVEIPVESGLSELAFRRLAELRNPSAPLSGILKWDEPTGQWVDCLRGRFICDEAACTEFATTSRVVYHDHSSIRVMLCDLHDSSLRPMEDG